MISFVELYFIGRAVYYSGRKNILFYTTVGKPIIKQLRMVETGSSSRDEVEDRDPNNINEHLQVKNKVK